MEPYRPYVDWCVLQIAQKEIITDELTQNIKKQLLQIPVMDVYIKNKKRPLMHAVQETTASLAQSFEKKENCIQYPQFHYV